MKTIRTVLLIVILLGAIMPAMAQVNFTEKTEFATVTYVSPEEATSLFLNVTDPNQITLTSSDNRFDGGSLNAAKTHYMWRESSCNSGNNSYNQNYFQIYSAETPIKRISLYIKKTSKIYLLIVGWKGTTSAIADYYKNVSHERCDDYTWISFDLSDWDDVKTVRLYGSLNNGSELYVNNKQVKSSNSSSGGVEFNGIQVGLSSNTTSISTYGFAAFSSTSALDFTNVTDCNAYYADSYAGGALHLTKATGVVPANFGLLLCATKGKTTPVCIPVATAKQAAACSLTSSNNAFVATSNVTYTPTFSTDAFALGVKNGNAGFYYVGAGVTIPQNRMYLPASKVAGAKSVTLDFGGIDPTGIVNVIDDAATSAPSQRPATDLLGRPCPNPMPGQMYIKDGKVRVK